MSQIRFEVDRFLKERRIDVDADAVEEEVANQVDWSEATQDEVDSAILSAVHTVLGLARGADGDLHPKHWVDAIR